MAAALAPFLGPLVKSAGAAIAPAIIDVIGENAYKTLSPYALKAIEDLIASGKIEKGLTKLANRIYGKSKTARKLVRKGKKVAGLLFGSKGKKAVSEGLKIGEALGAINPNLAGQLGSGYEEALKFHDALSAMNKPGNVI